MGCLTRFFLIHAAISTVSPISEGVPTCASSRLSSPVIEADGVKEEWKLRLLSVSSQCILKDSSVTSAPWM